MNTHIKDVIFCICKMSLKSVYSVPLVSDATIVPVVLQQFCSYIVIKIWNSRKLWNTLNLITYPTQSAEHTYITSIQSLTAMSKIYFAFRYLYGPWDQVELLQEPHIKKRKQNFNKRNDNESNGCKYFV